MRRKIIPTLPGYTIDEKGDIWSHFRYKPHKMMISIHAERNGLLYRKVSIRVKGKSRSIRYGIILLLSNGIMPTNKSDELRHLNCNSLDDSINNLAWGTHSENLIDTYKADGSRLAKLTVCNVKEIKRRLSIGENIRDIANKYGISYETVRSIKKQRRWQWVK